MDYLLGDLLNLIPVFELQIRYLIIMPSCIFFSLYHEKLVLITGGGRDDPGELMAGLFHS